MDFKASLIDGKLIVKPNIIKDKKGNVTVHVPSLKLMQKLKTEYGKRTIQQI